MTPVPGIGTADGGSAQSFPVRRSLAVPAATASGPTLVAMAPVKATNLLRWRPRQPIPALVPPANVAGPGANVQGDSAVAVAALDVPPEWLGAMGYGGAYAPPDSRRFPCPEVPSRIAMAPPHAGNFALGGPDAPPGSGIGARFHPLQGSDGTRRWHPSDDAAKRAEDSDLDAFREPLPVRMPSMGVEGDVGPAVEPSPVRGVLDYAAPPWHPAQQESRFIRVLAPTTSGTVGEYFSVAPLEADRGALRAGKGLLAGSKAASFSMGMASAEGTVQVLRDLRPPPGPWDARDTAVSPPAKEGMPVGPAAVPPQGPIPESEPPNLQAGRPVIEGLEAFKAASRAGIPVQLWRPAKPEVPGPPGARGGRGPGVSALAGRGLAAFREYEDARASLVRAQYLVDRNKDGAFGLVATTGGEQNLSPSRFDLLLELDDARTRFERAQDALDALVRHAGTQAKERFEEEVERLKAAQLREEEREQRKRETRPNYDAWRSGDDVQKASRDIRERANDIKGEAGGFRGQADAGLVQDARDKADDAKRLAAEADKAGKSAKNASKFGSKEEADAAEAEAAEKKATADAALLAAEKALIRLKSGPEADATKRTPGGPAAGGGKSGRTGKGGSWKPPAPPVATPVRDHDEWDVPGIYPECGDVAVVCMGKRYEALECPTGWLARCDLVAGKEIELPGTKGRGQPETPGDSEGTASDSRATNPDMAGLEASDRTSDRPSVVAPDGATGAEAPHGSGEDSPKSPPDTEPGTLTEADKALLEESEKAARRVTEAIEDVERRLQGLQEKAEKHIEKLARGEPLNSGERRTFEKLTRKIGVLTAGHEKLSNLLDAITYLGLAGLDTKGTERDKVLGAVRAMGEFVGPIHAALQRAERDIDEQGLRFAYRQEDYAEAMRLLRVSRLAPSGRGLVREGQLRAIRGARAEVKALGLDPDTVGSVELAELLSKRNRNAAMEALDAEAARGTGFWGGVARGLQAFEKAFIELPVTVIQAGVSRLLGNTATSDAQYRAATQASLDVWRLLSNQDTELVQNRISQATLGTLSAKPTEYEEMYGEEGYVAAVRKEAAILGPTIVTALSVATGQAAVDRLAPEILKGIAALRGTTLVRAGVQGVGEVAQSGARFFIKDERLWTSIRRAFVKQLGPRKSDLMHVFLDRKASAKWIPEAFKNAGWNLLEMPHTSAWPRLLQRLLGGPLRGPKGGEVININRWIELVTRYPGSYTARERAVAESLKWGVRGLVATPVGIAGTIPVTYVYTEIRDAD